MNADRTELHDLAAARPDQVKALAALWEAWALRAQVKPYPADGQGKRAGNKKRKAARQN